MLCLLTIEAWTNFVGDLVAYSALSEFQLSSGIFILKNIANEFIDHKVHLKNKTGVERVLSKEYAKIAEFAVGVLSQPNIVLEMKLKAIKLLSAWSQLDVDNPLFISGLKDIILQLYKNTEYLRKISRLIVVVVKKNPMNNLNMEPEMIEKCDLFFKSELCEFLSTLLNDTAILCSAAKGSIEILKQYSEVVFTIGYTHPVLLYQVARD